MPDDCAQSFRVGRDSRVDQRRDDHAGIGYLCGETTVTTDDAKDAGANLARDLQAADQVDRYVAFLVTAADRKDQQRVAVTEAGTRSHAAKVVSQPSSFVRAVSSETLSVGA